MRSVFDVTQHFHVASICATLGKLDYDNDTRFTKNCVEKKIKGIDGKLTE